MSDSDASQAAPPSNRYDTMEWAGAFGDLGTLIPFIAAYIGVLGMDPFGILFAFGVSMLVCGLYYRTPIPVQPMKAIGAAASIQAVQTAVVTPGAVHIAALATGAVWLLLALSGLMRHVARWVPAAVVYAILLGLGMGFMLQGVKMMHGDLPVAVAAGVIALALLRSRRMPAMFFLLLFGAAVGIWRQPALLTQLLSTPPSLRLPSWELAGIDWDQLFVAVVMLALPQIPLTLGNAILAISHENNRLFPERPVTESGIAFSTGLMNLFSGMSGGVPMCHGAGGMAGHVAFGARTGGSVVILGGLLLVLALFFSGAVVTLFELFPPAVLGVLLFITGLQLAAGNGRLPEARDERMVVMAGAAVCIWNVAAGFLLACALHYAMRRGWLRL
ncbi:putative sulfate/molybdate transporter [Achromobacter denitrificans]